MFHVKALNKLPTTCILNWGPCFCMVQFIRDSSFMMNVVCINGLRAKNGYLDIRERIDQLPFP